MDDSRAMIKEALALVGTITETCGAGYGGNGDVEATLMAWGWRQPRAAAVPLVPGWRAQALVKSAGY
jgi:hypothetical protein